MADLWLRHSALHSMNVPRVLQKYGLEGYGIYWRLTELLLQSDEGRIREDYELLGYHLRTDDYDIIQGVIDAADALYVDDGYLYSIFVNETLAEVNATSEIYRKNARARWDKEKEKKTVDDKSEQKLQPPATQPKQKRNPATDRLDVTRTTGPASFDFK